MKRILCISITAITMALTSCTSLDYIGSVPKSVIGPDYSVAGKTLGEACALAYTVCLETGQYSEYTDRLTDVYTAVKENGLCAMDKNGAIVGLSDVNEAALVICESALTVKYGPAEAKLITAGIKIAGSLADRLIMNMSSVSREDADDFVNGFILGIENTIK